MRNVTVTVYRFEELPDNIRQDLIRMHYRAEWGNRVAKDLEDALGRVPTFGEVMNHIPSTGNIRLRTYFKDMEFFKNGEQYKGS